MRIQQTGVSVVTDNGRQFWVIDGTQTDDDGTQVQHRHFLPVDTLEWRAAEYGIDPADTATLLDLVLAEPHLSEEDWAAGHRLHDAPDIDTARVDHLARCARAKLRHKISTRTKGHPCRRVADESPMHPEALELKRTLVARARAQQRTEVPVPDRLDQLRAAVHGRRSSEHERGVGG